MFFTLLAPAKCNYTAICVWSFFLKFINSTHYVRICMGEINELFWLIDRIDQKYYQTNNYFRIGL